MENAGVQELQNAKSPGGGEINIHGLNQMPTVMTYNHRQGRNPPIHSVISELLQLLNSCSRILLVFGLAFFVARSGWADGGTIRFQGDAGLFHVTVFTLPPILTAGAADVTVLVQDRSKLNPLLDANVTFDLTAESGAPRQTAAWLPPACAMSPTASLTGIPATLNHGENRLLYGAFVQFPYGGTWKLKINIRRDTERESVETLLRVNPPTPPVLGYWQLFILPPLGVLGFIVNRSAKRWQRASALSPK